MRVWEHEARRWRLNQVRKLCDNAYARGVAESAFTCRTDSSRLAIEHLRWPVLVTSPLGFALAASGPAWANEYGRIRGTVALARVMAALSALSLAPDLDVIAFRFGIAYGAPFGHRGAAHSICAALALASIAALARRLTPEQVEGGKTRTRLQLLCASVAVSHCLLDTLTDGGLGIALLWPLSNHRYFAPWTPIPVAPIGARMLTGRGLRVVMMEALQFAPLLVWSLWPRRRSAR